jgi:hypothetical protein
MARSLPGGFRRNKFRFRCWVVRCFYIALTGHGKPAELSYELRLLEDQTGGCADSAAYSPPYSACGFHASLVRCSSLSQNFAIFARQCRQR